ncbi:MAG: lipase family protein [Roseiarcus sp.]|jgi:hypothetical protein
MLSHAELARLAGLAYRGPWSGRVALDCEYDLLPRLSEVVIPIPGTNPSDALDWIRDFRAWPRRFPTVGICHAGFGSGGTAVAERALAAVKGDERVMTVVGHSLGGAMALIIGARLIAAGYPVRVVTFGAPRVAFCLNRALRPLVRRTVELVEYRRAGDPVPHLPMRPFYRHLTRGVALGAALPESIANHAIGLYERDLAALGR